MTSRVISDTGWSKTVKKRLFKRFTITDSGCWEFNGAKTNKGYGIMGVSGHDLGTAHRISWILHNGPIPNGLWVLHKCDNRKCFNPLHLYLGTVKENGRDASERGRVFKEAWKFVTPEAKARQIAHLPRGAKHHRSAAKFTPEIIKAVREATGSQKEIGKRFGMCQQNVSSIKRRKYWGHL